jgi:hypothetical protein
MNRCPPKNAAANASNSVRMKSSVSRIAAQVTPAIASCLPTPTETSRSLGGASIGRKPTIRSTPSRPVTSNVPGCFAVNIQRDSALIGAPMIPFRSVTPIAPAAGSDLSAK